jgi:hemerythrin
LELELQLAEVEQLKEELEEQKKIHYAYEEEVHIMQESHATQLEELKQGHATQLEKLKEGHDAKVNELKKGWQ